MKNINSFVKTIGSFENVKKPINKDSRVFFNNYKTNRTKGYEQNQRSTQHGFTFYNYNYYSHYNVETMIKIGLFLDIDMVNF